MIHNDGRVFEVFETDGESFSDGKRWKAVVREMCFFQMIELQLAQVLTLQCQRLDQFAGRLNLVLSLCSSSSCSSNRLNNPSRN